MRVRAGYEWHRDTWRVRVCTGFIWHSATWRVLDSYVTETRDARGCVLDSYGTGTRGVCGCVLDSYGTGRVACGCVSWTHEAQNKVLWWVLANTRIKLGVTRKIANSTVIITTYSAKPGQVNFRNVYLCSTKYTLLLSNILMSTKRKQDIRERFVN